MNKMLLPSLALSLALASCSSAPTAPATAEQTESITGTVVSGSGTGKVVLNDETLGQLSEAQVAADGGFTLLLPAPEKFSRRLMTANEVLGSIGCVGTLQSSVPGAKGYGVVTLDLTRGTKQGKALAGQVTTSVASKSFEGRAWIYTDQATTLSGAVDCQKLVGIGIAIPATVNVTTQPGWNALKVSGTGNLFGVNARVENGTKEPAAWRTLDEL
ncbi:hypothetical protein [Deinococcus wulumuqiensis]|uniref:DUF5666 domain-containing protein n=1 Tax=Deinococcus wulumuqiensis TaxID=980427 RepID=A0AAV4K218_9DEIO|nr:hypothetical protein [Deinococcus wulumuqiensis]QII19922.1 hypothetical protein G6R31_03475 [Deinococcus wulumuqiensis R12]GGI74457.1 hypothetical protein GCM10010914_05700 [Deinococcus wulumuqiensis]GGP29109.1 hypothetical protein GCM10008021_07600 [Deinococcus wulumuqiensis]